MIQQSNKISNNSDTIFGPPTDTVVDCAASDNFGKLIFNSRFLSNIRPDPNPIPVAMPDGNSIVSSHIAEFNHPNMPQGARTIRLFPHMRDFLLSLGRLCDNGCTANFTKDKCQIYDSAGRLLLTGTRNRATNFLWHLDPSKPDFLAAQMNSITSQHSATLAE
jgi:hypothetical protein